MHFSHALVAVLSVVGTQAAALPVAGPSNGLIARSANVAFDGALNTLAARGLAPEVASESKGVFARYADVADGQQRSMLIARDLSKRGILDMLVQAISDLLTELLGTNPSSQKRDSKAATSALQQLTGLDFSDKTAARQSFAQMLDMLGKALEQQATVLQQGSNSTNATGSGKSKHSSGSAANSTSTALPQVGGDDAVGATNITTAKQLVRQGNKAVASKRSIVELAERQEGVQGLLEVLRQLVDAILNTLLPMNSRSTSSTMSTEQQSSECPSPGTPNDGMYRPGCPGYGRRAVTDTLLKVRDAASSSDQLAQLLPLLQQLTQELPQLSGAAASAGVDGDLSAAVPDATASVAAQVTASATASPDASFTGAADASATAVAPTADPASTVAQAVASSAAQQSLSARDLLDADGFELAKRQQNSLISTIVELVQMILQALSSSDSSSNSTDASSSKKASSSSGDSASALASLLSGSMSKRDGIDLSILNNLLGNLLSGAGSTQSSDNDKRDGLNLSILNNLLGNLLSGAGSTQSSGNDKRDGLNLSLLNNLLGNLLSGAGSTQSADQSNAKRDGIDLSLLNNLLGNLLSGAGSTQSADKRDGLNLSLLNNLLGNLLSGEGSSQSASNSVAAQKRDGIDLSILDNLLGNLLSGSNSSQTAGTNSTSDGGINISALNNLLGNLLSGFGSSQSRRSFIELTARADFKPVWEEIKKVGNDHFKLGRRASKQNGLANVWSTFRDMVDQGYKQGLERRAPSPKVDTSAFSHATAQYLKDTLFAGAKHDRRSLEHLKPLADAASKFAKQQMQEWTEALNEHTAKHAKSA